MFGNMLSFHSSITFDQSPDLIPVISWVWGEATHFIHPATLAELAESNGIPLNKEWSFDIHWLWFYLSVRYNRDVQ